MHPVRAYIQGFRKLSEAEWQEVAACLSRRTVTVGETLLEEGRICRHLYFLETGLLRYYYTLEGLEYTKFFTVAPYCFTSQQSINQGVPAQESIAVVEGGILWQMPSDDAFRLLTLSGFSEFVRLLVQEVQFNTERILNDTRAYTAEERYRRMLAAGDPLVARVPLKYLASYLGIAPQSLSRIRKRLSSNS